jgi:hypothetical protein
MIAIRHAPANRSGSLREPKTALRAGSNQGDTSPLGGLAYGNAAFADVNVFPSINLHRFLAFCGAAALAYANLLIPRGQGLFAFSGSRGRIRVR